jgi:hypothetical protein
MGGLGVPGFWVARQVSAACPPRTETAADRESHWWEACYHADHQYKLRSSHFFCGRAPRAHEPPNASLWIHRVDRGNGNMGDLGSRTERKSSRGVVFQ